MRQVVVASPVLPPTARDLPTQDDQLQNAWLAPTITDRKLVPPGLNPRELFLEAIDVPPGASLPAVEAAAI